MEGKMEHMFRFRIDFHGKEIQRAHADHREASLCGLHNGIFA